MFENALEKRILDETLSTIPTFTMKLVVHIL
jgi:hypothetical protein